MSLPVPNLDDRTWTQIVEEARTRIPRRSPEWTDWNAHDPGITFLELFAWIAELQRYRVDRVSDATYRRFFQRVGLVPVPLRPARVWVRFQPIRQETGGWLLVPAGTPVTATGVDVGTEGVGFEVARDGFLTRNHLKRVTTDTGPGRLDHTEANQSREIAFHAFGAAPDPGALLELEFDGPFSAPEFALHFDLFEEDLPEPGHHGEEPARIEPSVELAWEYHQGGRWRPLSTLEDGADRFYRSGTIRFETPASDVGSGPFRIRSRLVAGRFEIPPRVRTLSLNVVELVQVETEVNEVLDAPTGRPDQTFQLAHDSVLDTPFDETGFEVGHVVDWDRLRDALTAPGPDGRVAWLARLLESQGADLTRSAGPAADAPARQERDRARYRIARAIDRALSDDGFLGRDPDPALARAAACDPAAPGAGPGELRAANRRALVDALPSVFDDGRPRIEVGRTAEGGPVEWRRWEPVDDFFGSGPGDRHYVLDAAAGVIGFGNGLNGRVPRADELVRARIYRHSRGARGNLPSGGDWVLELQGTQLAGRNPRSARGGRDPESIAESRERARQRFFEQSRGVTASDLEMLACRTPGLRVARARALPNHDPRVPTVEAEGSVTIVVTPVVRRVDDPRLQPGAGFLDTVRSHLERHRVLTTSLHVIGPEMVRFGLSVRVFLAQRASASEVRRRLEDALTRFFDPLAGGPDPGGSGCGGRGGWPFGRSIHPSEIYERIDRDPGVDYATRVRLRRLDANGRSRALEIDESLPLPPHGLPQLSWDLSRLELVGFGDVPPAGSAPCAEPCPEDTAP